MKNLNELKVFIICRDKVEHLKQLIAWLKNNHFNNIYLLDNDSSYKPLLDFYQETDCKVLYLRRNTGASCPWSHRVVQQLASDSFYIVSDPDVIPISECPSNWIEHLYALLIKYPQYTKVGFSLKIDDIPDHYMFQQEVVKWEMQFYEKEIESGVYEAEVDTTFALYRPNTSRNNTIKSLRTGFPYQLRHMPWYSNSNKLNDEEKYYRTHSGQSIDHGTWSKTALPNYLLSKIKE